MSRWDSYQMGYMRTGNVAELMIIEDGLAAFVAGHVGRIHGV